ncbi:hypothetical protein [Algivirga pacifica]|uniref:Outer membrane porin, OprD family n=1 Tax=Algivirga pacifica TaxID=1162670 RepID=A0ABP9CZI0_9BACT
MKNVSNRKKAYALFLLMAIATQAWGQDSLWQNLVKGSIYGEWRSFYMVTDNTEGLKDFQALTTGGRIGYATKPYRGWNLKTVFYASQSFGISDLTALDSASQRRSRYELALLDIQNPEDLTVLLWGEAYLQYQDERHQLRIGRMRLKTPFLNLQDGRMIPTLVEGGWYRYRQHKWSAEGGVIWRVAPRSTSRFFGIGESVGINGIGRGLTGESSLYRGNTTSNVILIGNVNYTPFRDVQWEVWDYWVHNIFHMPYTVLFWNKDFEDWKFISGVQYAFQHKVGNGGNDRPLFSYFENPGVVHMVGGRVGGEYRGWKLTLNANVIRGDGRFLFPREWGREPLFSFQRRERAEGTGNSEGMMVQLTKDWEFRKWKLKAVAGYGYYWRSDPLNAFENKYAIPEYEQLNLNLFADIGKRWRVEYLIAYKANKDEAATRRASFIINKVDMANHNLVLTYRIGDERF